MNDDLALGSVRLVRAPKHTCGTKGMKNAWARRLARKGCPACEIEQHLGDRRSSPAPGAYIQEHRFSDESESLIQFGSFLDLSAGMVE